MKKEHAVAVIVAAGKGSRIGENCNKLLLPLGTSTIIETSLYPFLKHSRIRKIYLVASLEDYQMIKKLIPEEVTLVKGGPRRQDSVHNALVEVMKGENTPDAVLIHDGARPFCSLDLIDNVLDATQRHDAAIPVLPINDTVRRINNEKTNIVDRSGLYLVQTPQGFRPELIYTASKKAKEKNTEITDDASLLENISQKVATVDGEVHNIKITTPADLEQARCIINSMDHVRI
tara:strand:- start:209 stop:904 length:696 start_codon:yes stop_codon:yes gene_type:complete